MTLKDLNLDKVFCINLARRPERKYEAQVEIDKLGISVEWYDAIDSSLMSLTSSNNLKPGMVGCYLSHYFILQHCLMNGYERILILEDDIQLITGGNSLLAHALPKLPTDWQFVYLGCTIIEAERHRTKTVNDYWCVPGGSWGTQAYMINGKDAIRKIYNSLKQIHTQIDLALSYKILPESGLKYYSITPACLRQLSGRSDVQ